MIVACILSPVIIVMGFVIAKEYHGSGRLIFRTIGADTKQQGFGKTIFLFFGLQKFDLQLNASVKGPRHGLRSKFLNSIFLVFNV